MPTVICIVKASTPELLGIIFGGIESSKVNYLVTANTTAVDYFEGTQTYIIQTLASHRK